MISSITSNESEWHKKDITEVTKTECVAANGATCVECQWNAYQKSQELCAKMFCMFQVSVQKTDSLLDVVSSAASFT